MITASILHFNTTYYKNKTFLVIGVKNNEDSDLDLFLKRYKGLQLIKRMPEVVNPNYLAQEGKHTLQPALVSYNPTE